MRQAFPNIQEVSTDMLRGLAIPSRMTQQPSPARPPRREKEREKGKIFKRQSYHLAVAYQIHVNRCIENGVDSDPTLAARRMRAGQPS